MIVAKFKDAADYKGISPLLDRALDLLNEDFLNTVGTDTVYIDGKELYATLNLFDTAPDEELFFENHHDYLDIHALIGGEERMDIADPAGLTPDDARSKPENDFYAFTDKDAPHQTVVLTPGTFLVAWPTDVHRCRGQVKESSSVRKVVFKIRLK